MYLQMAIIFRQMNPWLATELLLQVALGNWTKVFIGFLHDLLSFSLENSAIFLSNIDKIF